MCSYVFKPCSLFTLSKHCIYTGTVLLQSSRPRFPYFNKHKKVSDPARQEYEYFEKLAQELPIDDRYIDAMKNLWEEKIGSEREVSFKGDDRLIGRRPEEWVPNVDLTSPRADYADLDWQDIPESVKKIFSIEFGQRRDYTDAWKKALIDKVKKHDLDRNSLEVKIAWATGCIRSWSVLVDEINNKPKKPTHITNELLKMIEYRRKLLRQLHEVDAVAFEKVLSALKIAYRVPKLPEDTIEKRRKAWTEALLKERIKNEKEKQLEKLHAHYIAERKTIGAEMKKKLDDLDAEEARIKERLKEIDELEGKITGEVPKYQPKLIEELSEISMHAALYHRPEPLQRKPSQAVS